MILYHFRSNLENKEFKNKKEISKLEKSGIIHRYNSIDFYANDIHEKIRTIDDAIIVLCHIERMYNVTLTDISFHGRTKLNHIRLYPSDVKLMKEIINSGLYICLSKELERRNYTMILKESKTIKSFYSTIKHYLDEELLKDETYKTLETPFNRMYVRLASHCLRLTHVPSNSCNNDFVPTLTWYNFVYEMNETIKDVLESNFSFTDYKEICLSDKQIEKEIKEQPEKFKKACLESLHRYKQHLADSKRRREEMEEARRLRDARMEMYDKACDRFGGPMPYSVVGIL